MSEPRKRPFPWGPFRVGRAVASRGVRAALRARRRPWRQPVTRPVDRSSWRPGPWDSEPDVYRYSLGGIPCLMVRSPRSGTWCGYVHVPPGHPWSMGVTTRDIGICGRSMVVIDSPANDAEVHGGVTYQERREPRGPRYRRTCGLWVGFDCMHAWDLQPGYSEHEWDQQYRDFEEVGCEVDGLAMQALQAARDAREPVELTGDGDGS